MKRSAPYLRVGERAVSTPAEGQGIVACHVRIVVTIATCVLAATACTADRPDSDTAGAARIVGVEHIGDLATHVARAEGLFEAHGLEPAFDFATSGSDSLAALRARDADFAMTDLVPVVLDRFADPSPNGPDDPIILASLVHSTALLAVVTRADAQRPVERIAYPPATDAELVRWLAAATLPAETTRVQFVPLPPAEAADALVNEEIGAAILWEPWPSRVRDRLGDNVRVRTPEAPVSTKWVLTTRREVLSAEPELVEAVLGAYRAAIEHMEEAPEATLALWSAQSGTELPMATARWHLLDYDLMLDWSLIAAIQQISAFARASGESVAAPPFDVPGLIATAPLESVSPWACALPPTRPWASPEAAP